MWAFENVFLQGNFCRTTRSLDWNRNIKLFECVPGHSGQSFCVPQTASPPNSIVPWLLQIFEKTIKAGS